MSLSTDPLAKIEADSEAFRDHIGTITAQGKRAWVYAKKPKGRFYRWRSLVGYLLLFLMFAGPYVRLHGQPLLLLNVLENKYIIFGFVFWPQDFYLAVLGILSLVLTITLFTSVFGRIWCGWTCPQTVFLEMLFRKIEYAIEGDFQQQKALAASPWNANKILRKGIKIAVFYALSFAIANTFLAYIIGSEALWQIIREPISQHVVGFLTINAFSIVFFLVFARFREQVCQFACPYGRLQSALVDNDTISVTYDFVRGENRGTLGTRKKAAKAMQTDIVSGANLGASSSFGDCIDCGACVVVCPAAIDIRNGIQLECIQCTACIDACDKMMDAVGKPRGLIRYTSYNNVLASKDKTHKPQRRFPIKLRIVGYMALWFLLVSVFSYLILARENIETVLLRQPGMLAHEMPDGAVGNLYTLKFFNKTFDDQNVELKLANGEGEIRLIDPLDKIEAQKVVEVRLFIALKKENIKGGSMPLSIEVWSNGKKVNTRSTTFISTGGI
ncbi:MAG TPA: cytochrome c oxidase accessory protein CcoG [Turneriella sp.]|nr:cytochrome c oxidase accessory protein CcoG [Turneriella sp.]